MANLRNISYWVDSTEDLGAPSLDNDVYVDVAVLGGGVVGMTTAFLLQREGKKVAVIDLDRVGRGVSGYTTAKVTVGHGLVYQELEESHDVVTARLYAEANQAGFRRLASLV